MVKRMFLILAVVALMAAMMLSGPAAMAKKHSNHGKHKGHPKVTLCFNGHTIKVGNPAAAILIGQGATEGACPVS